MGENTADEVGWFLLLESTGRRLDELGYEGLVL